MFSIMLVLVLKLQALLMKPMLIILRWCCTRVDDVDVVVIDGGRRGTTGGQRGTTQDGAPEPEPEPDPEPEAETKPEPEPEPADDGGRRRDGI